MWSFFIRIFDWLGRAQTIYALLALIPTSWFLRMRPPEMLPHEVLFFASFITAASVCAAFYAHKFLQPKISKFFAKKLKVEQNTIRPLSKDEALNWAGNPNYKVWQAACLWAGISPIFPVPSGTTAYAIQERIRSMLRSKEITSIYFGTGPTAEVTKEDLIKVAKKYNERPKFLFPK